MNTFDDVWLSRYPRPKYIGFDNGGEYKNVFEELVNNYGIKKKHSTPFNPQSNGIIERVHLRLNDSLRTAEIDGREMDEKDPWGTFLSSAAYAIRSTFHTTLKATPGQLRLGYTIRAIAAFDKMRVSYILLKFKSIPLKQAPKGPILVNSH
jgi:transposase InsO family protein